MSSMSFQKMFGLISVLRVTCLRLYSGMERTLAAVICLEVTYSDKFTPVACEDIGARRIQHK